MIPLSEFDINNLNSSQKTIMISIVTRVLVLAIFFFHIYLILVELQQPEKIFFKGFFAKVLRGHKKLFETNGIVQYYFKDIKSELAINDVLSLIKIESDVLNFYQKI